MRKFVTSSRFASQPQIQGTLGLQRFAASIHQPGKIAFPRRGLWLVGLLAATVASCAPQPKPPELAKASGMRESVSVQQASKLAPQAIAHADSLLQQAEASYEQGDTARAAILAEQAMAAFQRAVIQIRLVQAKKYEKQAREQADKDQAELHAAEAEVARVRADIDQLRKKIRMYKDAPPPSHASKVGPHRQLARIKVARSLTVDANIMCKAAAMLGCHGKQFDETRHRLAQLTKALEAWPTPAPIDQAYRLRARCLGHLTRVRRRSDGTGQVGLGDVLLAELTRVQGVETYRDDRGVVVVLPVHEAQGRDKRLAAVKSVLKRHPGTVAIVVEHTPARASKKQRQRVHSAAQQTLQQLQRAVGKDERIALIDASSSRPRAHEPIPPPRPSQNERIEIILVPPST